MKPVRLLLIGLCLLGLFFITRTLWIVVPAFFTTLRMSSSGPGLLEMRESFGFMGCLALAGMACLLYQLKRFLNPSFFVERNKVLSGTAGQKDVEEKL